MLFFIFFAQILVISNALPEVSVNCGRLTLQGFNSCEITHNDLVANYTGPNKKVFPDLKFGLISYTCDHTAGYLVSEINCTACDYKCFMEEPLDESNCQNGSNSFWWGVILGVVFAALIGGFVFKRVRTAIDKSAWFDTQFYRPKYPNAVDNSLITNVDENTEGFLENETENFEKCTTQGFQGNSANDKRGNIKFSAPIRKTLLSTLAGLLLIKSTKACDVTIVMQSNNVSLLYNHDEANNSDHQSFFGVEVGQEICIEDHFGGRVSLQVSEILIRSRYELAYYTSDYGSTKTTTVASCCNVVLEPDYCTDKFSVCFNKTFAKLTDEQIINGKDISWQWQCNSDKNKRTLHPVWVGCLSTKSVKKRSGELYRIYRKITESGTVKFAVSGTSNPGTVLLNDYEPYQLTGFQLHKVDEINFTVRAVSTDMLYHAHDSMLLYEDEFYYVHSSEVDQPEENLLGDYQMSLDRLSEKFAFNEDQTRCNTFDSAACKCNCSVPKVDSEISKFAREKVNFSQPENLISRNNDSSIIHTFDTLKSGIVHIGMGNWPVVYTNEQRGYCDIEFIGSYGCASCNDSAYVVMKTYNVTKEGKIPFFSDCSFDKPFIRCDYDPVKLVLKENRRSCNIRLPTLKKTFMIDMKYFNFGHHVQPEKHLNCAVDYSFGESLARTSNQFIGAFVITVVVSLITGLILMVVFRVLQTRKNQNQRQTNLIETNLLDL